MDAVLANLPRAPIVQWLPKYSLKKLQADVIAGCTVGLMVVPQSLAYAKIAGLPSQYGLYTAFVGCFVYALLGSAKDVTLGPTAIMSLMVATQAGLDQSVTADPHCVSKYSEEFCVGCKENIQLCTPPSYALILALMAGLIQLALGLFKLGFLVEFISYPVLSGFVSAAAITIATGQIKHLFGVKKCHGCPHIKRDFLPCVHCTFQCLPETRYQDFVMALLCILVLYALQYLKQRMEKKLDQSIGTRVLWFIGTARSALVVVVAAVVARLMQPEDGKNPFTLTGKVKSGLPAPSIPDHLTGATVKSLIVGAVVVTFIGYLESIAIAKAFARDNKYEVDPSQELIALGSANVVSSFFSSYPVTGSFSRTAVNAASGVETCLGQIFTGLIVLVALAFATSLFQWIPSAALGSIIFVAVIRMVKYKAVIKMWKVNKVDLVPWLMSFFGCLFLGIEDGIMAAIGLSVLFILYEQARPSHKWLSLSAASNRYEPVVKPTEEDSEGVLLLRVNGPLTFPNTNYLRDTIEAQMAEVANVGVVILDCSAFTYADFTGAQGFDNLVDDLALLKSTKLFLCCVNERLESILRRVGAWDKIDVFPSIAEAHTAADEVTGLLPNNTTSDPQQPLLDLAGRIQ